MHDILAIAETFRPWPANVRYAAGLAALVEGSLTGLYLASPPPPVPDVGSASLYAELVEIARNETESAHRADSAFRNWAAGQRVLRSAWHVSTNPIDETLGQAADWYDLVTMERGAETTWGSIETIGRLLLTVGLPFVLVPRNAEGSSRLDTIAVAWKGTAESSRALHASLPLLRRAKRVVLIRDQRCTTALAIDWTPPIHVDAGLAWQGINVAANVMVDDDQGPGAILAAAARESADLLVMGAYGRSRLNEWVFGGATRHALEHAQIPLLMRH